MFILIIRDNIFKSFPFSLAKKRSRSRPKIMNTGILTPAPDQIFNRLRLQLKNLGSDRLRLCNTVIHFCYSTVTLQNNSIYLIPQVHDKNQTKFLVHLLGKCGNCQPSMSCKLREGGERSLLCYVGSDLTSQLFSLLLHEKLRFGKIIRI